LGRILEERGSEQDVDIQELVNDAFLAVDEQLAVALQQGRASGCTAIMAYMRKEGNAVKIMLCSCRLIIRAYVQVLAHTYQLSIISYSGYSILET
jgi:hypothetical protein